jgi:hypothetical protein
MSSTDTGRSGQDGLIIEATAKTSASTMRRANVERFIGRRGVKSGQTLRCTDPDGKESFSRLRTNDFLHRLLNLIHGRLTRHRLGFSQCD